METSEELVLIENILKGHVNDYEKIVDKYSRKVHGYIFKLVRNEHIAEELAQETFIKTYRHLDRFDTKKSFSVWILKIARNTALDYFKSKKRCSAYELKEELDFKDEDSILQNPANAVERKERLNLINEIINNLPKKYRELIVLKYFEELNYNEIALRLDISTDKVKWRLYQARKKMVKEYEKLKSLEMRGEIYGL
ncbi:MAG: RNA polymerase sigma factor [Marinisporobacter sp.]|jgi:RNA polymerase sigma-70 factor (ECF subfamily)|nr:RNA polymerase sigma factor [Marinisporobacter sp.]